MPTDLVLVLVVAGVIAVLAIVMLAVIVRSRVRVDADQALVISKLHAQVVRFSDAIVLPIVQRGDLVDLSVKRFVIARRGHEGLICRDRIRADVKVTFLVRVNRTTEDVLRVVQRVGAKYAGDPRTLESLFEAKFSEALKMVAAQHEFAELYAKREALRDQVIMVIGTDLNGYILDDAAIDYLEQTPISALDPNNVLDAQGIRKIHQLTKSAMAGVEVLPTAPIVPFARRLADQGLFDIEIGIEVACSVATERTLSGRVADHRDVLSSFVAPALLDEVEDAELSCRDGKATVRFASYATESQVLSAARIVQALKQDASIFR